MGFYDGRSEWEHEEFPALVEALSRGEGYGGDEKGCIFWDELDEYDKVHERPFEVECYAADSVSRLTYAEFYSYVEIACERYSQRFPAASEPLEESLCGYKKRFL